MSPHRSTGSAAPGDARGPSRANGPPPRRDAARILVIDGNQLTAEAIVLALSHLKFAVRFVAPLVGHDVRDLASWGPHLALLDIDSVDNDTCIQAIAVLHEADVPVAVVGGGLDECLLGECVQAGARSVVDKSSSIDDLVHTVRRLLAREVVLGEEDRRQLTEPCRREARARRARLTPFDVLTHREKCVLAELMDGHGAEVIARRASVSVSTVRTQIKAILQKLGVNSQLAAAAMARRAGWSYDPAAGGDHGDGAAPSPLGVPA